MRQDSWIYIWINLYTGPVTLPVTGCYYMLNTPVNKPGQCGSSWILTKFHLFIMTIHCRNRWASVKDTDTAVSHLRCQHAHWVKHFWMTSPHWHFIEQQTCLADLSSLYANQRQVSRSCDHSGPIRGQHLGHVVTLSQIEALIQVTWSLSANQRPVSPSLPNNFYWHS